MLPCKPGLLVLSQPSIGRRYIEVSRAEANAENGIVPEAPCRNVFRPPVGTLEIVRSVDYWGLCQNREDTLSTDPISIPPSPKQPQCAKQQLAARVCLSTEIFLSLPLSAMFH